MVQEIKKRSAIRRNILSWYKKHARTHLPWRLTHDAYHILVSEVMLQQTQVDRVIPKYLAFLASFPTVKKLAEATPARVIMAWQGLGYNRRALFLKRTAETVLNDFKGVFPEDKETLKTLPGVGDYTARAILSFAFQKPIPMMDTNHRRFYSRVFFGANKVVSDEVLLTVAEEILPKKRAYDWNQALMDFGSLQCTAKAPLCGTCPLNTLCKAAFKVQKKKRVLKKPTVRFLDSNRYVRGRIIETLRVSKKVSRKNVLLAFPDRSKEKMNSILEGLLRDGLIEEGNGVIVLKRG